MYNDKIIIYTLFLATKMHLKYEYNAFLGRSSTVKS